MRDPLHLLVIDDDPAAARLIQTLLEHSEEGPFCISSALQLQEALRLLEGGLCVSVVILDLYLPDSQGVATVHRFREVAPELPIVVVSGWGEEDIIFEALRSGAQDYIVKDHLEGRLLGKTLCFAVERHRAQRAREENDRLLTALIDNIPDRVYFKDAQSRFTKVNLALLRAFAVPDAAAVLGRTDGDFLSCAHAEEARRDELRVLETGEALVDKEERECWPDGRELWVTTTKLPIVDEKGRITGTCGITRDITRRVWDERKRQRDEMWARREERLRSLSVMAGGIAHDFNNLLMAMTGNAELALTDAGLSAELRSNLQAIRGSGFRAAELCRQMLLYSGYGAPVLECIDLSLMVSALAAMIEVSVPKTVRVVFELQAGLPVVLGDRAQLRELVLSLISNASEAMGTPGGQLRVVTSLRECDAAMLADTFAEQPPAPGPYVVLEVMDNGCGLDPGAWESVLDPFYSTKFLGRGLGLAAVSGIVRGHRGALKVASEKNRGTTFSVLLPPVVGSRREVPAAEAGLEERAPERPVVLVVDDEEVVGMQAARMVERMGYAAMLAARGDEAVDLYMAHAREIVAVLLDMTMPVMDGGETMEALRRINPEVRVLLSSNARREQMLEASRELAPAGFISKPYELTSLRVALEQAIGRTRTPQPTCVHVAGLPVSAS